MCLLEDFEEPQSNRPASDTFSPSYLEFGTPLSLNTIPSKLVKEVLLPPLQRGIQLQIDAAQDCSDLLQQVRV